MNPLRGGVVALAGLVGVGVLAWPSVASPSDGYLKRDEQDVDLVMVNDDDDSDPDTADTADTRDTASTRVTAVTRDDTRDQTTRGR